MICQECSIVGSVLIQILHWDHQQAENLKKMNITVILILRECQGIKFTCNIERRYFIFTSSWLYAYTTSTYRCSSDHQEEENWYRLAWKRLEDFLLHILYFAVMQWYIVSKYFDGVFYPLCTLLMHWLSQFIILYHCIFSEQLIS